MHNADLRQHLVEQLNTLRKGKSPGIELTYDNEDWMCQRQDIKDDISTLTKNMLLCGITGVAFITFFVIVMSFNLTAWASIEKLDRIALWLLLSVLKIAAAFSLQRRISRLKQQQILVELLCLTDAGFEQTRTEAASLSLA